MSDKRRGDVQAEADVANVQPVLPGQGHTHSIEEPPVDAPQAPEPALSAVEEVSAGASVKDALVAYEAYPQFTYTVGVWANLANYCCNSCPWDTLNESDMPEHLYKHHILPSTQGLREA